MFFVQIRNLRFVLTPQPILFLTVRHLELCYLGIVRLVQFRHLLCMLFAQAHNLRFVLATQTFHFLLVGHFEPIEGICRLFFNSDHLPSMLVIEGRQGLFMLRLKAFHLGFVRSLGLLDIFLQTCHTLLKARLLFRALPPFQLQCLSQLGIFVLNLSQTLAQTFIVDLECCKLFGDLHLGSLEFEVSAIHVLLGSLQLANFILEVQDLTVLAAQAFLKIQNLLFLPIDGLAQF